MDTAVALVQAYLNINSYFTVVEYPILENRRHKEPRTVTDLDILALRFPRVEHSDKKQGAMSGPVSFEPDPVLQTPHDRADMIVGEIKEGQARFNPATQNPRVLSAALARFGCCASNEADDLAKDLLRHGHTTTSSGHQVRMVAFGVKGAEEKQEGVHVVSLGHIVEFLQRHLQEHWDVFRHAQLKQPVLGLLALLEKARSKKGK